MKIFILIIGIFIGIQFFPLHSSNPKVDLKIALQTDEKVMDILKKSCYDCHSFETKYTTLISNIAPFSFVVNSHVEDGRKALNFSKFQILSKEIKKARLQRAKQLVQNDLMPLPSYLSFHEDAKLSKEEKKILLQWFEKELGAL